MKTPASRLFALALLFCSASLAAHAPPPASLMLATGYAPGIDVSEYWVSEKLDGVRARWDGARLITRGGYPLQTPAWFTAGWPAMPMDGELWAGRGRFERVSATVRTAEPDEAAWRRIRFMVFDLPSEPGPFTARVERMRERLPVSGIPWLQPVEQFRVADAGALDARLEAVVAAGGEGLMLHHQAAHYRHGRSTDLVKYKPFDDAEARVIGHTEGQGKYRGMLGALVVERPDGLRFRLGSGFSDAQRADPPPIGTWVTYRYNGLTAAGIPRFARFLRIRHESPSETVSADGESGRGSAPTVAR